MLSLERFQRRPGALQPFRRAFQRGARFRGIELSLCIAELPRPKSNLIHAAILHVPREPKLAAVQPPGSGHCWRAAVFSQRSTVLTPMITRPMEHDGEHQQCHHSCRDLRSVGRDLARVHAERCLNKP
jgi:hypothetical protein